MPQPFDNCRAQGGSIKTISLKGGKYMRVCYLGSKSYPGEIRVKKSVAKNPGYKANLKAKGYGSKRATKVVKNSRNKSTYSA